MTRINLLVLRSKDIDIASEFYRLLGVEFVKHSHGSGPEHYAAEVGMLVFELYPLLDSEISIGTRVGFAVKDVDSVFQNLVATGAAVVSRPKDSPLGRRAVIKDPDGHRVELTQTTDQN